MNLPPPAHLDPAQPPQPAPAASPRHPPAPSRTPRSASRALSLLAIATLSAFAAGCHSNGDPVVGVQAAPGPLGSTILLPTVQLSPPQSPIRQAAIDPGVTRQQTQQIMDDIASRRKTIATLSPADRERLRVLLAAQKSDKLKGLGRKFEER
ncbi:MAG: hypothetical protein K2X32_13360 [Phycisphaerales bacterium]|nr:hypothetical protein [Phycisphaerales bacterium]